jgi:hypothetical protein
LCASIHHAHLQPQLARRRDRAQLDCGALGGMLGPVEEQFAFKCTTCGKTHVGVPDLGFDVPHQFHTMSDAERRETAQLTADTCVIAGEDFFVRGSLEIPVNGREFAFTYGVWVSLSSKNFQRYQELFERRDRIKEPAYFGWLCNRLPGYPDTLNLKTNVILQSYPLRPRIELQPTEHRLAVEQQEGISIRRLQEILEANEHPA